MNRRHKVYEQFRKYKQGHDARTMEEICTNQEGFQLQVQQQFLKDYVTEHPDWKSLLLYHQIGSGKTCTAITIAEKYLELNPGCKVTVVLPARLKTNFVDEMRSPCAMHKYISAEDVAKLHDNSVSANEKKRIKSAFTRAVNEKYTIMSFEAFKSSAFQTANLTTWVRDFTKDHLIIVDEVHNLISGTYKTDDYKKISETHTIHAVKGANAILFKYMNKFAHSSCKMLYLTATPIFNHIFQFKELVSIMCPERQIRKGASVTKIIEHLRGRVSFFPGTSPSAYPEVVHTMIEVPLSRTQDEVTHTIQVSESREGTHASNEDQEAFKSFQRMASVACLPNNLKITPTRIRRVVQNLEEYAPKIAELMTSIEQNPGKHVVYSTFIANGIDIAEAALRARGWVPWNSQHREDNTGKMYAVWNGTVKDEDKTAIKSIVNRQENISGDQIRVILGSPSIKEGVSFKHIQHLHLLDPVWNSSAMTQVEGRAIRFCSHVDIPINHPFLQRKVNVHCYKSVARPGGSVDKTADMEIYDEIIPDKQKNVQAAERALKKVAIDYLLFRNMYVEQQLPSPSQQVPTPSPVSVHEDDDVKVNKGHTGRAKKKNTCPRPRRPARDGTCPSGMVAKENKHGHQCCYKVTNRHEQQRPEGSTTQPRNSRRGVCPKPRRPTTDASGILMCPAGYEVRTNQYGNSCCYKTTTTSRTRT